MAITAGPFTPGMNKTTSFEIHFTAQLTSSTLLKKHVSIQCIAVLPCNLKRRNYPQMSGTDSIRIGNLYKPSLGPLLLGRGHSQNIHSGQMKSSFTNLDVPEFKRGIPFLSYLLVAIECDHKTPEKKTPKTNFKKSSHQASLEMWQDQTSGSEWFG